MTEDEELQKWDIRQYMAKHPDASPEEIAKALKVQVGLVYQEKANLYARTNMTEDEQEGVIAVRPVVGAVLCGVLILAIVATTVAALKIPDAALGLGMIFIVFLPLASIPVGLLCLVGVFKSGVALRRHPSPAARIGLWLSLASPIAVLVCYAACFVILSK